ncbi:L-ascorbate oxidase-like [Vitis vinifera]|uniref:L-ascorbate oxidase-like n=1 Tax=Vitis vinifera TaxID=29760 RepID=A0A438JTQ4_VITVI|nr:L-ascorbate oxidase-like [Vitis vinifera]
MAQNGGIILLLCATFSVLAMVGAEDPYRFFEWNVTYGDIYPLGVRQQGILINGQFQGLTSTLLQMTTSLSMSITACQNLSSSPGKSGGFELGILASMAGWELRNGVQQRRNSFEDGVYGTTCPIPPGKNFTYILQVKDQIGSFFYFPSLAFHKAAGGFGGIRILSRPRIPVPFPDPAGDYTILIGDCILLFGISDLEGHSGPWRRLPFPDGILINGRGANAASFTVERGKTYRLRISNVGLQNSLNFRIQGHKMTLVEVEGTHTLQTSYSSLDVHVGQSYSVLVTADQAAKDYYIAVSSRFTEKVLTSSAVLHYSNSVSPVSGPLPGGPTTQIDYSLNQARSIRTNLTASGPRPNPQGSYHYGLINITRTIKLGNTAGQVNGKQRYAVNRSIPDQPSGKKMYLDTSVMGADFRAFVEIVFENRESIIQSWHLDGYSFWVVGMNGGVWTPASRNQYNLRDAVSRCTTQVYPKSWTAVYIALDNVGMWNLRTEFWARQYLGQQFYLRVYSPVGSIRDEYPIPKNALLCGRAAGRKTRSL